MSTRTIGIMTNNASPSADALATINGMGDSLFLVLSRRTTHPRTLNFSLSLYFSTNQGLLQMTENLPQAIVPAFATSTFAVSVDRQILGGNLHWVIFFVLSTFHIYLFSLTSCYFLIQRDLNATFARRNLPIQLLQGHYMRLY